MSRAEVGSILVMPATEGVTWHKDWYGRFSLLLFFCHDIWMGTRHIPIGYYDNNEKLKALCAFHKVKCSRLWGVSLCEMSTCWSFLVNGYQALSIYIATKFGGFYEFKVGGPLFFPFLLIFFIICWCWSKKANYVLESRQVLPGSATTELRAGSGKTLPPCYAALRACVI